MRDTLTVAVLTCLLCKLPLENFIFGYVWKKGHNSETKSSNSMTFWSMIVTITYIDIMQKIVSMKSTKYFLFFFLFGEPLFWLTLYTTLNYNLRYLTPQSNAYGIFVTRMTEVSTKFFLSYSAATQANTWISWVITRISWVNTIFCQYTMHCYLIVVHCLSTFDCLLHLSYTVHFLV